MLVQINYLRNHKSVDGGPLLSALCEEVSRRDIDTDRLLVNLDWLQYRKNFRPPVDARRYVSQSGERLPGVDLAVDVRRLKGGPGELVASALAMVATEESDRRVYLEESHPPSRSLIWS